MKLNMLCIPKIEDSGRLIFFTSDSYAEQTVLPEPIVKKSKKAP